MTNVFDIDGVIFMGFEDTGVYPGPNDIIITGRSHEEMSETLEMLKERGINNVVYFNPLSFDQKTRETSGLHKADTIIRLLDKGENIKIVFEDDPIQAGIIKQKCPTVNIVLLDHALVEKENVRHVRD